MSIRVAVVGVSGYSGLELMKIILRHPAIECAAAMASEATGAKALADMHPQLRDLCEITCLPQNPDSLVAGDIDTAFLCTPNEVSHALAPALVSRGIRVIDLSGSFRLRNGGSYASWYGFEHCSPRLLREAVYGLPEWNARAIVQASLVANPGCYATSALLALLPLVQGGILEPGSDIFCDAKSGVTGAGRKARLDLLFGEVHGNFRPYSPISHRHVPEICQELGWEINNFTFVPHLLPLSRGILSTIYVKFPRAMTAEEIGSEYRCRYDRHPFIRLLGDSRLPEIQAVAQTNFCDLAWRLTPGGLRGVIFSAIDNLGKGAAGQAVQNFNLMHGLEESLGLTRKEAVAIHD